MEKKLPNNWVETELDNLFRLVYGKSLRVKDLKEEGFDVYGANGIIGKYNEFTYAKSKVIISCRGAASGAIHKTNTKSFITSNSIVLDEYSDKLLILNYAKYIMQAVDKTDVITGTAQPQITIQLLKNILFPLAPLKEQQRIVEKLDALFSQLDTIKTRLDKIPELLKNFRQTLIDKEIKGNFAWENGILNDVILEKPRNGISPRAVNFKTEVKSMTLSATTSGNFNPTYVKYLDIEKPVEDSHLWLKNGDILIQRSNSIDYVGTSAIYNGGDFEFIYPDLMMKVRSNSLMITEYLNYVLSSSNTKEYFRANATGTAGNMPKINQAIVMNIPIKIPSIQVQKEIVERVESLFLKVDLIERQYKTLKEKIETLPQAILYKAFKGELVEQLPTDGDAKELLKEIQKLKEKISKKGKKRKR